MLYDYEIYDPRSKSWFGDLATEYSKKYPQCGQCHIMTRLKTPREMGREENIRPATFECIQCGREVQDPIQFTSLRESDDVLGELMFKSTNQKN